jgi:hypothetical protein
VDRLLLGVHLQTEDRHDLEGYRHWVANRRRKVVGRRRTGRYLDRHRLLGKVFPEAERHHH